MKKFKNIIITICLLSLGILFNACHQHSEGDGHDHSHAEDDGHDHGSENDDHGAEDEEDEHGHNHGSHENVDEISLNQAQMDIIKIEFAQIEKKQLTSTLKANGLLKVPNQNKANVTTLMGGVIQNIYVQPGDFVKKGQRIATISNTSFIQMQEDFLNTNAELVLAQLEYNRQQELQTGNAGALKNLQSAKAKLNALQTKKASLKKQLALIGINANNLTNDNIQSTITITSPIQGVVAHVLVNIGNYINEQNAIAEIVDNQKLHLDLFVYEKDINKLSVGQTIHFTLTNNSVKEYDAKVRAISNTFENNIKAISVHAEVEGDKTGLIDGMNITALVSLESASLDAIPSEAIVSNEGQEYIIIKEKPGAHGEEDDPKVKSNEEVNFKRIPVLTGTSELGYTEIALLQEIPSNSEIVTKGAFFVLAKMTNQGEAHSH